MATQGFANYLRKMFPDDAGIKVAVSYDCRNNSRLFAETVANVLTANSIKVYQFETLRPTPELSFAIRYLGCQGGIMVTASHNPKEYNGYKVYWDDGGQLVPPHDENVIREVEKITGMEEVQTDGKPGLVEYLDEKMDILFIEQLGILQLAKINKGKYAIRIVYTPLHGTGGRLIPRTLRQYGYSHVSTVEEQMVEDGNFPTAKSPNPEEAVALELALKKAKLVDADLVLATDPDADRVGIAIKDPSGKHILLNGNQTGALLMDYVLGKWKEKDMIEPYHFVVTTIVTSEIMKAIAAAYQVKIYDVLTGFKWIADVIRRQMGIERYIIGLEESYGYMISDFVRDKDAVGACLILAEMAAEAWEQGKTMYDKLMDVYLKYGFYMEGLISINKEGKEGLEEIGRMMNIYREHPPKEINGSNVVRIADYQLSYEKNTITGEDIPISLPKSNVLQFFTEDGSKISIRPSGTEPKIKFYFSVKEKLADRKEFDKVQALLKKKIEGIINSMGLK
jgi:phosphoglucomutase